jgi:hypothetical protein
MKSGLLIISGLFLSQFAGAQQSPGISELSHRQIVAPDASNPHSASDSAQGQPSGEVRHPNATGAAAGATSGIVYICDPTITAIAGLCDTLNTTISGLYSSAFANANANIYIQFGDLAGYGFDGNWVDGFLTYTSYRSALQDSLAGPNDTLAFSSSVPSTNPLNANYQVLASAALRRALGFSVSSGINSDQQLCALGTPGCYDGVITIGKSFQSSGLWFYRTGIITANQFDFFTAVEFETNEILGFYSCLNACRANGVTFISPID